MAVVSGKDAVVDVGGVAESGLFASRVYEKHMAPPRTGSNQQSGVMRDQGNTDWGGWYRINGHTPIAFPNDSIAFENMPVNTGTKAATGTARCLGIEVVADVRTARTIYTTVFFGANGVLSKGQALTATDSSNPVSLSPKGLCAYFGSSQANTVHQKLRIFSHNVVEYVDCTTDGQVQRTQGDIDATFEWIVNTDDLSPYPVKGNRNVARMYVTSTTYWELTWMRIADCPDAWEIDRTQNRKPVQAKFSAEFTGFDGTGAGTIINPALVTKWP